MKKRWILVLLILALLPLSLAAEDSDYYVRTISLLKVYPHSLGYKVVYMKSNMDIAAAYIPLKWFKGAAGKGEVISGDMPNYPYMSVFWKDGQFDHVRLYIRDDYRHPSWGELDPSGDLTPEFSVETLDLAF